MAEYEKAVSNEHTLKIGRVYDRERDYVLVHKYGKVIQAYNWSGEVVEKSLLEKLYPTPIEIDMQRFISVGDLWWVPGGIGMHYGLDRPTISSCFLETREYMMGPDFVMSPVKGFKETMEELCSKFKLVLLTNSPQPDSEIILEKLGLDAVFHKKIFQGKKPTMTVSRFEDIKSEFNIDFTNILSVGDNLINDILPPRKLGCKTIYIDAHNIGSREDADSVVGSISEMLEVLRYAK